MATSGSGESPGSVAGGGGVTQTGGGTREAPSSDLVAGRIPPASSPPRIRTSKALHFAPALTTPEASLQSGL